MFFPDELNKKAKLMRLDETFGWENALLRRKAFLQTEGDSVTPHGAKVWNPNSQ
jgi:hypothetical protein